MSGQMITSRDAGGALTTTVPGVDIPQSQAQGLDAFFRSLAARRLAAAGQPQALRPGYETGGSMEPAPQFTYRPSMGASPAQANTGQAAERAPATRMRRVQIRTAIPSPMEGEGLTYNTVPEYQLPDGSWSRDAEFGTLAGNEAAARQRMASIDRDQGGADGPVADDPRMQSLVRQSKAAREPYGGAPIMPTIGGRG
jgi:hypothetical protein